MELVAIQALPVDAQKHIKNLELKVDLLLEELRLATLKRFGRSSENFDPLQPELPGLLSFVIIYPITGKKKGLKE